MIKSKKDSLMELGPLRGELPAASASHLTVMVCGTDNDADTSLIPVVLALHARWPDARIHAHVLDAREETLARLTLLSAGPSRLPLTVTYESTADDKQAATPQDPAAFALIRFSQINAMVPGKLALQHPLTGGLEPTAVQAELEQHPVLIGDPPGIQIAADGSDTAKRVLAAIAKPLVERVQGGGLKLGEAVSALVQVRDGIKQTSPQSVGSFPSTDTESHGSVSHTTDIPSLWVKPTGLKVLLLKPDLALPFKSPALVAPPEQRRKDSPFLTGPHGALRAAWQEAYDHIERALTARGHTPLVIERPGSDITPALANLSGADVAVIPHRQQFQCPGLTVPAMFLMQVAHRWLFTLDPEGWGAGAAAYPYDGFKNSPADSGVFERYNKTIREANESKFDQPIRKSRQDLMAEGTLPDGNYIFFPCQIPDDEVVRFFCDETEDAVISSVSTWANENQITVVFKAHPAAPHTAAPFREIASGPYVKWADASIHDLLEHCDAVYTLNSGVGHEAILHGKPVVMFGRAEYDRLAIRASLSDLDGAYARVKEWNFDSALDDNRRFYTWFTRDMALDLSDEDHLNTALMRIVDQLEHLVQWHP